MVVPMEITFAVLDGDNARVLAWLDADVAERRDVNDTDEQGFTLLYSTTGSDVLRDEHLALARELIARGADVNEQGRSTVGLISRTLLGLKGYLIDDFDVHGERLHKFVLMLIGAGIEINRRCGTSTPPGAALLALRMYEARPFLNIVAATLRAGASMDSVKGGGSAEEWIRSLNSNIHTGGWANRVHWAACTKLVDDIRAAGGTWTAYRKQSRKDVLLLRSLMLRGRTKDATDPVIARVFQLPNEMCWNVLKFWRATSAATGEVI